MKRNPHSLSLSHREREVGKHNFNTVSRFLLLFSLWEKRPGDEGFWLFSF
jgi:hypothetical protein